MRGAKGTRTPDPLLAKQVLFQLSYSPSHEVVPGYRDTSSVPLESSCGGVIAHLRCHRTYLRSYSSADVASVHRSSSARSAWTLRQTAARPSATTASTIS